MKEQINKVVITGAGCVTNRGLSVYQFCKNIEYMVKKRIVTKEYEIKNFKLNDRSILKKNYRLDIACQYILNAVDQALESAHIELEKLSDDTRIAIIIGSSLCLYNTQIRYLKVLCKSQQASSILFGQTANNLLSGIIPYKYKFTGLNLTLSNGWTSGLDAICLGKLLLENGKADIVIAGGVDVLTKINLDTLKDTYNCMGNGKVFNEGFHAGSGAGIVILETQEKALRRNAGIKCYVGAVYQKAAGNHKRLQKVLKEIMENTKEINKYFTNQNGTTIDEYEMDVINQYMDENHIEAIKKYIGECGAASGVLQIIYALYLKNKKNLIISVSNTGRLSGVEIDI